MTRRERIEAMGADAQKHLDDGANNIGISAFNYGLKPGPGLLKSLRAYGFNVRYDGFMGYYLFKRDEVNA